jgi:hypothetical protein
MMRTGILCQQSLIICIDLTSFSRCVWLRDSWGQAGHGCPLVSSLVPPILRDDIEIVLSQPLTLNQTTLFKGSSYPILFCHYNQTHSYYIQNSEYIMLFLVPFYYIVRGYEYLDVLINPILKYS